MTPWSLLAPTMLSFGVPLSYRSRRFLAARRPLAMLVGIALLSTACSSGTPDTPTAPITGTGSASSATPFQLRVDSAVTSRQNVSPSQVMPVRYAACYAVFPVSRGVTVTQELTPLGPDGQAYPTAPNGGTTRRFEAHGSYGGCGGVTVLDHDLAHPVATRYRLTFHYVEDDGRSGTISGEADVKPIVRTPAVNPGVVIHEFTTHGANGPWDQFIELKNISGDPVTMTGWYINLSDRLGFTVGSVTVPSMTLPAGCHVLLATDTSSVKRDYNTSFTQIQRDGGLGLFNRSGEVIDQVAMSVGSAYREGTPLQPLPSVNKAQSYERGADTDNNAADFVVRDGSTPTGMSACTAR